MPIGLEAEGAALFATVGPNKDLESGDFAVAAEASEELALAGEPAGDFVFTGTASEDFALAATTADDLRRSVQAIAINTRTVSATVSAMRAVLLGVLPGAIPCACFFFFCCPAIVLPLE